MYREVQLKSLLEGRRILIAGYGREGKSSERLIRQLLPDADLTIVEGNESIQREAERGYDLILKSPGIPTFVFEGHCDLSTLTSQTDIFLQVYRDQTFGITGTKGKSTTTHLIASLLRCKYSEVIMAGNMGIPLFDIIPDIKPAVPIVCEFSCHQLENIHCAPHVSLLLNLHQEHLDHYHSYEDYQMAKMQIYLRQREGCDWCYFCGEDSDLMAMVQKHATPERRHQCYTAATEEEYPDYTLSPALRGHHNRQNLAGALLAVQYEGLDEEAVGYTLQTFQGLDHRLQLVGTHRGITFYNDSIATIPAATIAACTALKEVDTLILGGFDRGIDYGELIAYLHAHPVPHLVFVGEAGRRMKEAYKGGAEVLIESDYERIIPWCYAHTTPGKICLLSPAAASYDAFKNFEERGRVYQQLIEQYA